MTRKKRWLLIGLAFVLPLFVLVVGAWLGADPLARHLVAQAGRSHGVEIQAEHVDIGWGWVRLRKASFELEGVSGARATVDRATVDLDGLSPTRAEMRGLSVTVTGSAAGFVVDLGGWAKRNPDAVTFPVVAEGVRVVWREAAERDPWLLVNEGFIAPRKGGARLTAERASVLGAPVGPVGAVWTADGASVTFGFGNPDPAAALARMDVDPNKATAQLTLRPIKLADLSQPLGVDLPIPDDVILEGTAELALPSSPSAEVSGELHAKLRGYVPPHPKELDGIVFGDVTKLETRFRLASDRRSMQLEDSRVEAGAFVLAGKGTIERVEDHATIEMRMAGNIPCTALAKSAAVSRLGDALGGLLGDAAKRALAGSVRVGVIVHADSRRLEAARVEHEVGIGCRLKLP